MYIFCGSCQINFLYRLKFIRHLLSAHYLEGPNYSCELCWQQHSNKDELERHMRIHIGDLDLSDSDGDDMPPSPQPPTQQSPPSTYHYDT